MYDTEVLLKCSSCDKPLIFVWINKLHNVPIVEPWLVRAKCYDCNDYSFIHEIHYNTFTYSGYHLPREKDDTAAIPITEILDISIDNKVINITTERAK